ncbi:MAG: nuclear transport factor 2 family protein [Pseudomonadota bacterium]
MDTDYQSNIDMIVDLPGRIPDRLDEVGDRFLPEFQWHYFNKGIPEINKTYDGLEGLKTFFADLGRITGGTFSVKAKTAYAIGSELVVVHAIPSMTIDGMKLETDAAVVWRIVDGKIAEAWDIPGLNSAIRPL